MCSGMGSQQHIRRELTIEKLTGLGAGDPTACEPGKTAEERDEKR